MEKIKTALLHYWLITMRGGEKVLESIASQFPEAPIYTHAVDHNQLSEKLRYRDIRTTFISKLPFPRKFYQKYLPLMPLALEELDLREYDLVISSESGPAKGVITGPNTKHICYCHSPMRYIWDMYPDYLAKSSLATRLMMRPLCHYLRQWDVTSSQRVDVYVANSSYVAARIRKFYGRDSIIIPPPVAISTFSPSETKEEFYLFFGELVGYKRADLALEAFRASGRKLVIAGKGEEFDKLKRIAPPNVIFTGALTTSQVRMYLAKAKALIFPGIEDFGMVPVEAMASGTPVIAIGKGGVLDSVIDKSTGLLFESQTVESLNERIEYFESESISFSQEALISHSAKFSIDSFESKFQAVVSDTMKKPRYPGTP